MTDREAAGRGGLFAFTTRRPVATTMAVLAVAVFGGISLTKTPLELLPEISYPTITVRTEYQGAGPEDMEERISKPIEETLAVLPGLEAHSSISRSGVSDVVLEFRWGTNLSFATQDIRERLDRTRLPDDADPPLILRYDPSLDPVMRIAVFGEGDQREVRRAADEVVARGLATVPGVAAVKVRGGLETEIRVRLDAKRIASLGLDISEVDRRLKIENVNLASGTLVEGDTEYLVRTLNQFESIDEILRLSVTDRDGQPIRIRDLATVTRTHKKRDVVTRVDGREAVELLVYREADANIVRLAREVRDRLLGTDAQRKLLAEIADGTKDDPEVLLAAALRAEEEKKDAAPAPAAGEGRGPERGRGGFGPSESGEVKKLREAVKRKRAAEEVLARKLPRGMEASVLSDQSRFIDEAIDEVRGAALIGGLLAVLVLLLFLKSAAATAIIAVAIPVSIIATFAPMFMVGTTLNIMSLGGLALGVGMLVDNSIVVLESIFRCREEGDGRAGSSVRGTEEVGGAVFASTLTTIAVFFPIVFVSGVAGQLFGDQALTVVFSLLSSLVVALFFIPMLAARGRDAGAAGAGSGGPLRLLLDVATPIVLPHRTLAAAAFRANLGDRGGVGRAAVALLVLPVAIAHAAVEIAARALLTVLLVLLFVVALATRLLAGAVRLAGAPFQFVFDRGFGLVNAGYPRLLRTILLRPTLMFLVLVVAVAGGALALREARSLGTEMLPTVHQGELVAHVYLPVGTPVERTARALAPIERDLLALPEVEQVASAVGVGRDEIADPDEGGHSARVLVRLSPSAADAAGEERAIAAMRGVLGGRPELTGFRFSRPTLFSIKAPLEVHARGDDLETLRVAAGDIVRRMQGTPSLTDVRSTVTRGNPEVRLSFDREKLRRYGLDLEAIANRIRAQVQGVVSTRFADEEQRIDVRVLSDVDSVDALLELTVNRGRAVGLSDTLDRGAEGGGGSSGTGTALIRDRTLFPGTTIDLGGDDPIPLRQVADVRVVKGPSEIRRIDGQRAAVVTANSVGLDIGSAVKEIEAMLARVEQDHDDLICEVGGQGAEMDEAMSGMRAALLLAVFLVYLVMASQFESILQPLVILVSVPLAFVGGILSLVVTDTPLSVVAFIGGVVLAGIVVNNAIVLIDYTNRLRARGRTVVDALVEAGHARLRPILMTTLSTVLALLPLAGALALVPGADRLPGSFWHGSELQAPMAITVVGGLTLSTLLTLVVIPVVYRLVQGKGLRVGEPGRGEDARTDGPGAPSS